MKQPNDTKICDSCGFYIRELESDDSCDCAKTRTLVPLGPDVVYAPPAFKGQQSAKGATKARFAMIAERLRKAQTGGAK